MGKIKLIRVTPAQASRVETFDHDGAVIDFLEREFPDGFEGQSHLVTLDGKPVDPEDYDRVTPADGELVLALSPSGYDPLTLAIIAFVIIAVAVGLTLAFMPRPPSATSADDPQSVYSVSAQANKARVGGVIPVPYGRCVWTPDYASQSYRVYENNQETRYFLLCAGQGEIDVTSVRIGETPVTDLPPGLVRYAVFPPARHGRALGSVSGEFGLHENVVTSGDVSDQELQPPKKFQGRATATFSGSELAFDDGAVPGQAAPGDTLVIRKSPNDGDYLVTAVNGNRVTVSEAFARPAGPVAFDLAIVGGESLVAGPFVSNGARSRTQAIELDIEFPNGLHTVDDEGRVKQASATFLATFQPLGDEGGHAGAAFSHSVALSSATRTPQRRTWRVPVPAGRYSVSLQRTDFEDRASQVDRSVWTGLKAYLDYEAGDVYGDTTLLALAISGAQELSSRSQNRIFAETFARVETVAGGRALSANPADIIADIVTRPSYGAGQERAIALDLDGLAAFHASQSGRSGFNGVFDRRGTVWEALRDVAIVGRALPHPLGARLSVVEDAPRPMRASLVTPDLITRGSFSMTAHFRPPGGDDGVLVEYSDAATFQTRTALYPPESVRPRTVQVRGLADDAEALSMAEYIYRQEEGRSVEVKFGMEWDALNFAAFDRIGLCLPLFDWGAAGQVVEARGRELTLTRAVPAGAVFCALRDAEGRASAVVAGTGDGGRKITLAADLPFEPVTSANGVATPVAFGVREDFLRDVTVTKIVPSANGTTVTGHFYDPQFWEGLA
ncbi:host specificity factor TipJ family phage tail protein [Hyphomonas sp.]|uniref:host specificity factor TipJ family phage tail protein n=1 Tax=Hyphomonas sp. TaxID=87 RepID=UPI0025C3A3B9|nr:host specificity factor TipJ family phage tail protein [Hyphomonas sp.]MBI1401461.1 hypothetical protein [Hyphomonas sp.]